MQREPATRRGCIPTGHNMYITCERGHSYVIAWYCVMFTHYIIQRTGKVYMHVFTVVRVPCGHISPSMYVTY